MKIFKVRYEVKGMYGKENEYKYFVNEENAKKFVAEHDEPWTNRNGIEFHTAKIDEIIETEDEKED
jgi:hypothetical protein